MYLREDNMAIEKQFIERGIRKFRLEEFFENEFERAGYSHCEIRRTPMGVKIVIHADKPGLIIGRGGRRINEITDKLEDKFGFEDPQLDVQEIEDSVLNAKIVANEIKNTIERGFNYKRTVKGIMRSMQEKGAVGCEVKVSGKLSGSRGRTDKFTFGYLKSCGEPAKRLVDEAVVHAKTQPGTLGVKVRIMTEKPEDLREQEVDEEVVETTEEYDEVSDEDIVEILSKSIKDAKETLDEEYEKMKTEDIEKMIEFEEEGKDRKGMKEFLEQKLEGQ